MSFMETVEGYLHTKNEDSRATYAPRIYAFIKFLQIEKGVSDKNYIEYLTAIKIDVILESLNYYIKSNSIKKKSAAYFYIRTIKKYFEYLNNNGIENERLIKSFGYNNSRSYDFKMGQVIENNSDLEKIESKDAVDFEDIKLLITSLDEKITEAINDLNILTCAYQKNNPYNDLVYLLSIKLMIFSGIDYAGLRLLERNCFDCLKLKITINGYTIHIPDNLGWQLKRYIDIKEKRGIESKCFLVPNNGEALSLQTSAISDILNEVIGRGDTSGIRKYVITEMIRNGINQSFIMKMTGAGEKTFEDCQNTVNKERHIEANRYIDSKMRDLIVFDYL